MAETSMEKDILEEVHKLDYATAGTCAEVCTFVGE